MEFTPSQQCFCQRKCQVTNEIIFIDGLIPMWISRAKPDVVDESDSSEKTILLVVPGVPGLTGFYHDFIESLFEVSGRSHEVIGLSFPGHYDLRRLPWTTEEALKKEDYNHKRTLVEQSKLLVSFMTNNIPKDSNIIIIAHSAGSYVTLEALRDFESNHRIKKINLLFPALERIMETPAGQNKLDALDQRRAFILAAAAIMDYCPSFVKSCIVQRIASRYQHVQDVSICIDALLTYRGLSNVVFMAKQMKLMQQLNHADVIQSNVDKISFYYGQKDIYAPSEFGVEMKARFPNADVKLCQHGYKHAFHLFSPVELSEIVWRLSSDSMKHKL